MEEAQTTKKHMEEASFNCQLNDLRVNKQYHNIDCWLCNINSGELINIAKNNEFPSPLKMYLSTENLQLASFKRCEDCDFTVCSCCYYYVFEYFS